MTNHQVRPLAPEELDAVTGGMTTVFQYGNIVIEIYADATMYDVATTNLDTGKSSHKTTWPNPS